MKETVLIRNDPVQYLVHISNRDHHGVTSTHFQSSPSRRVFRIDRCGEGRPLESRLGDNPVLATSLEPALEL